MLEILIQALEHDERGVRCNDGPLPAQLHQFIVEQMREHGHGTHFLSGPEQWHEFFGGTTV